MKRSKKIALSGVFTALCFVILGLGSLIDILDLSAAALCGLMIVIAVIELGKGFAMGVYAASSLISLAVLPNKSSAALFSFFVGFYPIIKIYLNRIRPSFFSYFARISLFNIFLFVLMWVTKKIFGIEEEFPGFEYLIIPCANIAFICYDFVIERISVLYCKKLRGKLFRKR